MTHIGLETIFVEYVWQNMTLDHWNYGPHHVWTVPTTGSIIRMWQPFNGLQVMPKGTLLSDIDPSKLDVTPPVECLASSKLTFKIKCNASGYPVKPKPPSVSSGVESAAPAPPADAGMWRTVAKVTSIPHCTTPHHATPRGTTRHHTTSQHTTPHKPTPRHTTPAHLLPKPLLPTPHHSAPAHPSPYPCPRCHATHSAERRLPR